MRYIFIWPLTVLFFSVLIYFRICNALYLYLASDCLFVYGYVCMSVVLLRFREEFFPLNFLIVIINPKRLYKSRKKKAVLKCSEAGW